MKNNIKALVRSNILKMNGYRSARDEYSRKEGIFLDANESPYGRFNRYPDPYQTELKSQLAQQKNISENQIFIGNGSDEAIDLLMRIFCRPSLDKIIHFSPGYGMYQVSASIQDIDCISIPLNSSFQIDRKNVTPYFNDSNIKIVFICSPNNPTGNIIHTHDIEWILENFDGIVVIDEAYIDFADTPSWIAKVEKYTNLVILQTLSKAWGLAAARVGMAYSNREIISLFNKVKSPYNVSSISQKEALNALNNKKLTEIRINAIKAERERLQNELSKIESITQVYPSDTNFILIEIDNANEIYTELIRHQIIVRNQSHKISNCLRITVGTPKENNRLLQILNSTSDTNNPITEYGFTSSLDLINRH